MPLPAPANTTVDIYHSPNAPPAAPDVAAVPCRLTADFQRGNEAGASSGPKYTHVLLLDAGVDVRDMYSNDAAAGEFVYVPDQSGTPFAVKMVAVVARGTAQEHKKVWLARKEPTWPSDEL